jgi:hypothetical protein
MKINLKSSNNNNSRLKVQDDQSKLEEPRSSSFQISLNSNKKEDQEDQTLKVVLAIIGITRREKIVVLIEYKSPEIKLHIPAKTVNYGPNLEEMAREVFFRTTGYDGQMHQVSQEPVQTSSGQSIYTFAASNCHKTRELVFQSNTNIKVSEVSVQEFLESIAANTTDNVGSAFMALDHLGMLDS